MANWKAVKTSAEASPPKGFDGETRERHSMSLGTFLESK